MLVVVVVVFSPGLSSLWLSLDFGILAALVSAIMHLLEPHQVQGLVQGGRQAM